MVLFLFVVMMLDVNFDQLREGVQRFAPVGAAVGAVLFLELAVTLGGWQLLPNTTLHLSSAAPMGVSNTAALGRVIYTDYIFLFQVAGLILLVAMMGAIVLTHRVRPGASKRQDIARQEARMVADTLQTMRISVGSGAPTAGFLRPLPAPMQPAEADDMKPTHAHPGEH